jgi:c-di-GMP-binding flagellar brake protein YcgR
MEGSSRRRHRRIDALGRVFAQLGGGWEASVLNLSVGGMLLRLKRALTPGSNYVVKLFLEEQIAIVEARVVRMFREDAECFAALQFTSVPVSDAARLRGYVNPGRGT